MRSVVMVHAVFVVIVLFGFAADAQETSPPVIVALDQATADLWCSYYPDSDLQVVVPDGDVDYAVVNLRALAMCDAGCLLYRRDQNSLISRLFRERIANQGVISVDLVDYFQRDESSPRNRSCSGENHVAAVCEGIQLLPGLPIKSGWGLNSGAAR